MEDMVEEEQLRVVWSQKDESAAHTTQNLLNAVGEKIPRRLISLWVSLRGHEMWVLMIALFREISEGENQAQRV